MPVFRRGITVQAPPQSRSPDAEEARETGLYGAS